VQDLRFLIDTINAADEKRAAETFRFMEERKIKKIFVPKEWGKLKDGFRRALQGVRETAVHLEHKERGDSEFIVTNSDNGRRVSFTYSPDAQCIFYDNVDYYAFRISPDGTSVLWVDSKTKLVTGPDEVIEDAIMHLTR
jgi:hypothetical protein